MRHTISAFVVALACVAVPTSMLAIPGQASAMAPALGKGKGESEGKGKGDSEGKGKGDGKGKGKGKGKGQGEIKRPTVIEISGAGQRLHFSFGGKLRLYARKGQLKGKFSIMVHPLAPPGDLVSVACTYKKLSNPERSGDTFEFDAEGACTTLSLDGTTTTVVARNHITIVDQADGPDAIDVEILGSKGISVPGGTLSHGDFTTKID